MRRFRPLPPAAKTLNPLSMVTICPPVVTFISRLPRAAPAAIDTLRYKLVGPLELKLLMVMLVSLEPPDKNWTTLELLKLVLAPVIVTDISDDHWAPPDG